MGLGSSRDAWVYNSSKEELKVNMKLSVEFFNQQIDLFKEELKVNPKVRVTDFISNDQKKISWSSSLIPKVEKGLKSKFETEKIVIASYRPFTKQHLYLGENMIHRKGQFDFLFPKGY